VRRREFISLLGGAVAAWPLGARTQQSAMPVIGFISSRSTDESAPEVSSFRQGLAETGYVEHQNVALEYRWAENRYERLPALVADLISRNVAVIAAVGGPITALAVKTATKTIPFVFISGVDPVKLGLVDSFARPGGNATGVNMLITAVEAKRVGLLHELVPFATRMAILVNPNSSEVGSQLSDVETACRTLGIEPQILRIAMEEEIEAGFASAMRTAAQAVLVMADPFFSSQRERIVALAARHNIPAIYETRSYVVAGGLISYGPNIPDMYRQVGVYTGQILKGVKPADLPVIQPTALELAINLKTANALGLEIPPTLLARADEVIE
jgi:putative tryptophan/tyrosine transport system substrate-binding protein